MYVDDENVYEISMSFFLGTFVWAPGNLVCDSSACFAQKRLPVYKYLVACPAMMAQISHRATTVLLKYLCCP